MAKMKLTDKLVQALEYDAADAIVWDKQFNGGAFGLRLSPGGTKSFVLKYRNLDGRQRWLTIGAYPVVTLAAARETALHALSAVARGQDPAANKQQRRRAETFDQLWALYLERHAKAHKRSWQSDERIARRDILPVWGHRKIGDITRGDVSRLLDDIADRPAPILANRVKALISKMFNFAVQRGLCETNPAQGVARPGKERARDRVLTREEIKTLWRAFDAMPLLNGAIFKLRLLTAQRGQEICALRWCDVHDDAWTIPAEIAKNGRRSTVPLSAQAVEVLERVRAVTGDAVCVFPARGKAGHIGPRRGTSISRQFGIDFVPHDLRRTAAHYMAEHLNVRQSVISSILNHVAQDVTAKHYTHAEWSAQKRAALDAWGLYVEALVTGTEDNVVPFPSTAV